MGLDLISDVSESTSKFRRTQRAAPNLLHTPTRHVQEQDLVLDLHDLHDPACIFMATRYAFVTLITSDSYLPGALTLAAALRDIHPTPAAEPEVDFQTVCLVTPETVDVSSIKLLRGAFDIVTGVEIIDDDDRKGLELLGKSRCSLSEVTTVGAQQLSGLTGRGVDLYDLPTGVVHPSLQLYPRWALLQPTSERSRTRGPMEPRLQTQLIWYRNRSLRADSNPLLQGDLISASLSPNSTRSGSLSSPKSSTSTPTFCPSGPSLTCSLWTTSSLPYQTSDGRTFSILG